MNDLMVFVYFLCFAAVAGATFAYMYSMMNARLLEYNRSREKQSVHPEMSDVKSGEELLVFKSQDEEDDDGDIIFVRKWKKNPSLDQVLMAVITTKNLKMRD